MFSPNYLTTFFNVAIEMKPVFSSSNNIKTFFISSLLSLFEILAVIRSKNPLKSNSSVPYSTRSLIIWKIGWFLASPPNELNAALSSYIKWTDTFWMNETWSFRIKKIESFFDLLNFIKWDAGSFKLLKFERSFINSWSSWAGHVGDWDFAASHIKVIILRDMIL